MRLFIGVEFPPQILRALAECQSRLRALSKRGRFKHWDNFHLTLKFLGEVAAERVPDLTDVLADAAKGLLPFSLELGKLGQFGQGNPVRVIWIAVGGEIASLRGLQASVELAASTAGFEPEQRPWRPHITLAQDVELTEPASSWGDRLGDRAVFRVAEFALILSEERDRRRIYTPIHRFTLGG
ncbi:MAG: RNA 2',3'-cyclic phosphodiesterase [Negativicutes bacterium]|nr:RNA 2',3'-cyclic phosphodiesterase [Negativicutes bacterium]